MVSESSVSVSTDVMRAVSQADHCSCGPPVA